MAIQSTPQYKLTQKDGTVIAVEDRELLLVRDGNNPDNALVVDSTMLGSVVGSITGVGDASAAKQDVGNTSLAAINTKLGGTITVAIASTAVAGADASAANQVTGNNSLASINTAIGTLNAQVATQATLAAVLAKIVPSPSLEATQLANNTLLGTISTRLNATLNVAIVGGSTSDSTAALQTAGNASLASINTKLAGTVSVSVVGGGSDSSAANQVTGNNSLASIDSRLAGTLTVSIAAGSLGDASAANQVSGNSTLSAINTKLGGTVNVAIVGGSGDASAANQVATNTALGSVNTILGTTADAAALDVAGSINAHLRGIVQTNAAINTKTVTGAALDSTVSTMSGNLGAGADLVAGTDTSNASLIALTKRTNQNLSTLIAGSGGGTATVGNQTTQITAANLTNTSIGAMADAVASSDAATASLIALTKLTNTRLSTLIAGGGGATTGNQTTQITQETAINTVLGTTADAAVLDATGTVNAHVRGIAQQNVAILAKMVTGAALDSTIAATNTVLGGTADVVALDVAGSINAHLRGIVQQNVAIVAKLVSAPALEATQVTQNTTLSSILSKIVAAPALDATVTTGNGTLASILAKIVVAPALDATVTTMSGKLPASLGAKADTASLSVISATNDPVLVAMGAQADGAAATDTSTASLISLIKRNNQNLSTLIAGGGSATSGNQTSQITQATTTNTNLGAMADSAAVTDTATASLIALVKRTNQNLTTMMSNGLNTAIARGAYTNIVITSAATLGIGALAQSLVVDNTTNQYADAQVSPKITMGAVAPTVGGTIVILVYAEINTGVYSNACTGADAAYSAGQDKDMAIGRAHQVLASANTVYGLRPFSVCDVLGLSVLPDKWGVVAFNNTSQAWGACSIQYQGYK